MNKKTEFAIEAIHSTAGALLIEQAIDNMNRQGHLLSMTPHASEAFRQLLPSLNLALCATRSTLFQDYDARDHDAVDWLLVFVSGQNYRNRLKEPG